MAITTINGPQSQLDATVRIYDSFYNFDLVVESNLYELIYSYFYEISKSVDISKNFTTIIFRISNLTSTNPLDLLDELRNTNNFKSNSLLTYYLNSIQNKSVLYGINLVVQPNQQVQRNILN
jgi:hypothetical protein